MNCSTGEIIESQTGSVRGGFQLARIDQSDQDTLWEFYLKAAAADPITPRGTPDLDYNGRVVIVASKDRARARIYFSGLLDTYPAFEMYARIDGGPSHIVFQKEVARGKGVLDLYGDAIVPVKGDVLLRKRCGFDIKHQLRFVTENYGQAQELTLDAFVWRDDEAESGWGCRGTAGGPTMLIKIQPDGSIHTSQTDLMANANRCRTMGDVGGHLTYLVETELFAVAEGTAPGGALNADDVEGRRAGFAAVMLPFATDAESGHWEYAMPGQTKGGYGRIEIHNTVDVQRSQTTEVDESGQPPLEIPPAAPGTT